MLQLLTQKNYLIKDTFEAAARINGIPRNLLDNDQYFLILFDVVSLFSKVSLKRTVNIILDHVYKEKLIYTTLSKRSLKKLVMDTCQKSAFLFNNKYYEQRDGVRIGASLGQVLANIIMTECEKQIVDPFIHNDIVKFYTQYVDDTLLLIKRDHLGMILKAFNSFDPGLKFTADSFENVLPHFFDLQIFPNGLSIFRKDTHTRDNMLITI